MYWFRQKFGRLWPLILIVLMITVFFIVTTREENLNVYSGGTSSYTVEQETNSEKNIITKTYKHSEINFSIQIPDGWTYITKDGYDTYVHGASASSIG